MNLMHTKYGQSSAFRDRDERSGADYPHDCVVVDDDGEIVGAYDSREEAIDAVAKHFGDVPYQIMKVDGQPSIVRPMFIDMPRNEEGAVEWPPFISAHSIVESTYDVDLN